MGQNDRMNHFSDYIIYVDESGDHSIAKINNEFPIFVLVFCMIKKSDFANIIVPLIKSFKFRWFGHDAIILHEKEIVRKENLFSFLQNSKISKIFIDELNTLMELLPISVIACAINKLSLEKQYLYPMNPYDIALYLCIERAQYFLQSKKQHTSLTHIIAESRSPRIKNLGKEDANLLATFTKIREGQHALQFNSGRLDNFELLFTSKSSNSIGLQIADLIARPIGLSILRPSQSNRAFDIIKTKICRVDNVEIGLKIFP